MKASPLARRIAREGGIDLAGIAGSGPGGRIVRADVVGAAGAGAAGAGAAEAVWAHAQGSARASRTAAAPQEGARAPGSQSATADGQADGQAASLEAVARAKGETTTIELSRTQQTIARRMAESKATIPDFALAINIDMEALRGAAKACPGAELKAAAHINSTPAHEGTRRRRTTTWSSRLAALALRECPARERQLSRRASWRCTRA